MPWSPLILYSKPGCPLCEGLVEKLQQIPEVRELEVRDITSNPLWWEQYSLEVPVLKVAGDPEQPLPRPSPRLTVAQLRSWLGQQLGGLSGG